MDLREALVLFVLDGRDEIVVELQYRLEVCDAAQAEVILAALMSALERGVSAPDQPLVAAGGGDGKFRRRAVRSLDPVAPGDRDIATLGPADHGDDLAAFIAGHKGALLDRLADQGALVLRGFGCDSVVAIERVVAAISDAPYDTREHPRTQLGRSVFTPVSYPNREVLLWHNEDSFQRTWPARIWFPASAPRTSEVKPWWPTGRRSSRPSRLPIPR